MRPITASRRASACSWVSFSFFTRPPSWRSVTSRAFSIPASTNFWSMSLRTTGASALAIAWAVSPPIVPAPTTAASNTTRRFPPVSGWVLSGREAIGAGRASPHPGATLGAVARGPVPANSAMELKERLEAERRGDPFLVYRDAEGRQVLLPLVGDERVSVGRDDTAALPLPFDPEASRVHAELARFASGWTIADEGLSRNGTFVNGERVVGRRSLADGDALRFGST